jgi:nitrite reductase/ring-hydroxylating ferredoxin subunit
LAAEIPVGSAKCVSLGSQRLAIFNVGGAYYGIGNRCPHSGGPLCEGIITGALEYLGDRVVRWGRDGEIVRCPWHGWEFDITTGISITEPGLRVPSYPVSVVEGALVVDLKDSSRE